MITMGITAVGGGIGQSVMASLAYSPLPIRTVGMDVSPMSVGLLWANGRHLVPPVSDEHAYVIRLCRLCSQECLDVLVPGLDTELETLARHRLEFSECGCHVVVSSPEAIGICRDKESLSRFCAENDFPFAATVSLEDAQVRAGELEYPLIVKPRSGSGSVGARVVYGSAALQNIPTVHELIVQEYLPPPSGAAPTLPDKAGMDRLNQSGEISVQFFVGQSGEILGSFASVNRLKDGVPIEIVPEDESAAVAAARPMVEALARRGLRGPANLQGRWTTNGVVFFEINPRYTGITGIRSAMGYREVDAAVWSFLYGREDKARECLTWSPGRLAMRYVSDIVFPAKHVRIETKSHASTLCQESTSKGTVLVTGASGYVGSKVVAALLQCPGIREVRAAVRDETRYAELRHLMGRPDRLKPAIGDLPDNPWPMEGIDIVIHAAGVRQSNRAEEYFSVNTEGTRRLVESACQSGIRRLVLLSSHSVYGTLRPPPWSEVHAPRPETAYALSKWMAEQICLSEGNPIEQIMVLRLARVYGYGHMMRWSELPHKFARMASHGKALPVHNGGQERLDLVHISDVVRACVTLTDPIAHAAAGSRIVLNIGSGRQMSVLELAELCRSAATDMGRDPISIVPTMTEFKPLRSWGMDIRRAKTWLDWSPRMDTESALREIIAVELSKKIPASCDMPKTAISSIPSPTR